MMLANKIGALRFADLAASMLRWILPRLAVVGLSICGASLGFLSVKAAEKGATTSIALLRSGYAALKGKQYQQAVEKFSTALESGNLKRNEMAKAFYYRGTAYRKAKQPAPAIADFSSALWLKASLSKTERSDAEAQRAAAYKEAGAETNVATAATVAIRAKPQMKVPAQARPGSWNTKSQQPSSRRARLAKTKPAAKRPARTSKVNRSPSAKLPWQTSTQSTQKRARKSGTHSSWAPANTAAKPAGQTARVNTSSSPNAVTTFFSNLFGGTSAVPITSRKAAPARSRVTGSVPRKKKWTAAAIRKSPTSGKVPVKNPPRRTAERYILQVAALPNKAQAQALVRRLSTRHASLLQGRQAIITSQVYGNMGTLYRVQVVPFNKASTAQPYCKELRAAGLDCLVQRGK